MNYAFIDEDGEDTLDLFLEMLGPQFDKKHDAKISLIDIRHYKRGFSCTIDPTEDGTAEALAYARWVIFDDDNVQPLQQEKTKK